jgi:NAD(P)-dependent dehydrogenase (short-subunit alcohol dehydrogenase family)
VRLQIPDFSSFLQLSLAFSINDNSKFRESATASSMARSKLTWLITGASSGIGYELAACALAKGHQVVATSRSLSRLDPLKAKGAALVELDHNQSFEHVQSAIETALGVYQGVDIIVNNAAYVQTGMLEETT